MKVVIDIPEDRYADIQRIASVQLERRWPTPEQIIAKGVTIIELQKWIPCSEQLPDEVKKKYWVCTDTGYQCQCRWTNNVFGLVESDRWGWNIFDTPQYSKVIAWMPLPEPYKEDNNAD